MEKSNLTVVISGSRPLPRDWDDYVTKQVRSWVNCGAEIVVGDCPTGVDELVRRRFMDIKVFKADWSLHGKAAGPLRNTAMLDYAVAILLAFPRKDSKGTKDCINQAKQLGMEVYEVTLP